MPEFDALANIRSACMPLHRELEAKPTFSRLLEPDADVGDYAFALKCLYRFISPFEEQLASLLEHSPFSVAYVPRLPLILADLEDLGEKVPNPGDLAPPLTTLEEALGLVYVLEGSSQGSAVIARHLRVVLGSHLPFHYFGLHEHERWNTVKSRLGNLLQDEISVARAIRAASGAFNILISIA